MSGPVLVQKTNYFLQTADSGSFLFPMTFIESPQFSDLDMSGQILIQKTVTCPYNPSHQLINEGIRVQRHLVKCGKNHPESDVSICQFNTCHRMPESELQLQHLDCPDRKQVECWASVPSSTLLVKDTRGHEEGGDDWEAEAEMRNSYNPSMSASQRPVLRKVEGKTPSERRAFQLEERERLHRLNSELEAVAIGGRQRHTDHRAELLSWPSLMRDSDMLASQPGPGLGRSIRSSQPGPGWGRGIRGMQTS
jgi:hypothetical protein